MTGKAFPNGRLIVTEGDITTIPVDAIVNAANSDLAGGGGVDGAIHEAGGPSIMKELRSIRANGRCPAGQAVATGAGDLPAKWVFHAVGPMYRGGRHDEPALLRSCYEVCLRLADQRGVERISFPAISTGVYGYPIEEAARIALTALHAYFEQGGGSVKEAIFVLYGKPAFDTYNRVLHGLSSSAGSLE